jgi:hypothetical protein
MALSPEYGWPEPDNSSLVKNGAQDIRALGDAIDTSVWNVGYGQAGKNKIINGDFGVWQRGTSFVNPANGAYTTDRFSITRNAATGTVSQQAFLPGGAPVAGYEGQYFFRWAQTGSGANTNSIGQKIENVQTLAGQVITLSFWAKANVAISLNTVFFQIFGSGGSSTVSQAGGTAALTSTWTRFTQTITLPSISGKTIGTNSNLKLELQFTSGTTTDIDLWGVQVEYGSKATPFQTASGSIAGELALAQRYFFRPNAVDNDDSVGFGYSASTTNARISIPTPVTMRTTPTYTSDTDRIRGGGLSLTPSNVVVTDTEAACVNIIVTQTYVANDVYVFTCRPNASLSAEL